MIVFPCPSCRQPLQIPEQYAGTTGRCNFCGGAILVPGPGVVAGGEDCPEVVPDFYATPRRAARPGAGMLANEADYRGARSFSVWRAGVLGCGLLLLTATLLPALVIGFAAQTTPPPETRPRAVPTARGAAPAPAAPAVPAPAERVYILATGGEYHRATCAALQGGGVEVSVAEARARGLSACAACHP